MSPCRNGERSPHRFSYGLALRIFGIVCLLEFGSERNYLTKGATHVRC